MMAPLWGDGDGRRRAREPGTFGLLMSTKAHWRYLLYVGRISLLARTTENLAFLSPHSSSLCVFSHITRSEGQD